MFLFLYVMWNDALLSPRNYLGCYFLSLFETSLQNMSSTNMLSTSSSFSFFLYHQSTNLWSFFPKLLLSLLNKCFLLFFFWFPLFSFPQKSDALWPYLPHLLHLLRMNLHLCFFLSPEFSHRNFSLGTFLYCIFSLPNYVFQNQIIYFLGSLYAIFDKLP